MKNFRALQKRSCSSFR